MQTDEMTGYFCSKVVNWWKKSTQIHETLILGRYDGANKDADTALTEDPFSVPGILAKGEARYHQGAFEHALKYYYRQVNLIHALVM